MPYDSVLIRGGQPIYSAAPGPWPLIPEDVQREITGSATQTPVRLARFGLSTAIRRRRQFVATVRRLRRSL